MKANKTIAIKLRFWTNDLEAKSGKKTKACWDSGMAMIEPNSEKGIESVSAIPFNSLDKIVPAIKKHFRKQGILMVSDC